MSVYEEKIKVKRSELRAEEKREEYVSVAEGNLKNSVKVFCIL